MRLSRLEMRSPKLSLKNLGTTVHRGFSRILTGLLGVGKASSMQITTMPSFQPHEMLRLIQKGCFKILRQDKTPSAGKRLAKLQQLQTEGKIPEDIPLDFEDDLRVDQLAEYLVEVEKLVGEFASRETVANEMISYLGMSQWREAFTSIPSQGGVPLPWYFIAGKYLLQNRGKDENDMRDLFEAVAEPRYQCIC